VWLANKDTPGLAMSRSIGDGVVHGCGVSSEPEVAEHVLGVGDLAMVVGSDGVFEFMSNETISKLVLQHLPLTDSEQSVTDIIVAADNVWRQFSL